MVTGYVVSEVCDWLESACCLARWPLSLSSTGELMALVKTHLSSKMTVYGITNTQLEHISSLLLQVIHSASWVVLGSKYNNYNTCNYISERGRGVVGWARGILL